MSSNILFAFVGIGDRHLGNFLLDRSTGSLVGIDFGYAFGVSLSFPKPEYVPIRLTSSLRELLEPSGPAGLFGYTLSRTLTSLRHNSSLFLPSLQVCDNVSVCVRATKLLIFARLIDFRPLSRTKLLLIGPSLVNGTINRMRRINAHA